MQHALGYGSFRLGTYDARTRCISIWCQAAMLEREDRRDLHWRQPWTSDSLALGSEMKTRNHPIGRATDICPWSGCFYCWFVKTGTIYCQCGQGFFPATRESKELSRTFPRPFGSIPCVASSATTWVNLPNVGSSSFYQFVSESSEL